MWMQYSIGMILMDQILIWCNIIQWTVLNNTKLVYNIYTIFLYNYLLLILINTHLVIIHY